MNRALLFLMISLFFIACQSEEKKETPPPVQVKAATTVVDPVTARIEELKKTPVMDLDELKRKLPESLNGIKRNSFNMSSTLGYAMAQGDYEKNSKTYVRVVLYDCAGEKGAAMYNSSFITKTKLNVENEEGYTKTIDLNGSQAIESFEKPANATTLTYLLDNRVLVVMTGRNLSAEDMRKAAGEIK
jgi:hypothetical protein